MNNNIKIFVKGQPKRNEGTKYLFAYPDAFNAMDGAKFAWATIITDPRTEIRDKFTNGVSGAYKLMHGPEGNYFSILFYSDVAKESALGITVVLEHGVPVDGKKMVALLNMLRERLPGNYRNEVVDECLAQCEMDKVGEIKSKSFAAPTASSATPSHQAIGYRVYSSPRELEQLFTFHEQSAYSAYPGGILFVKAEDMPSSATFKRIDMPLVKHYRLPTSNQSMIVQAAKTSDGRVAEGNQVRVVFKKSNGCSADMPFVIGQGCEGVTYEGDAVHIFVPPMLRFHAHLALKVKCEGRELSNSEVIMNMSGKDVKMDYSEGAYVKMVDEADVNSNPNITLTVKAPGCEEFGKQVKITDLMSGRAEVSLKRKVKMMTLTVTIGGVTFRSGEIDEREIEKRKADIARDGFEMRGPYNGKEIEVYKPAPKRQVTIKQSGSREEQQEAEARRNRRGNWMIIAAACAALLLVGGITWGLYKWLRNDGTTDQSDSGTEQIADSVAERDSALIAECDYMKRSNQWERDSMLTPDAQALFDAIVEGKCGEIMNNPIAQKRDASLNSYLLQLMDIIEECPEVVSQKLKSYFLVKEQDKIDWEQIKKEVIDIIAAGDAAKNTEDGSSSGVGEAATIGSPITKFPINKDVQSADAASSSDGISE